MTPANHSPLRRCRPARSSPAARCVRPLRRRRPAAGSSAYSRISATSLTGRTSSASSTSAGTSSRSGSLRAGMKIVFKPARCAASSFCFTPPIGSTRPLRVTSPVMPTSARTGRPDASEASAVTIVTPADGPSFGTAPAGTCRCTTLSSAASRSGRCARRYDSAICADSFITSPSCPVRVNRRSPSVAFASMNSTSPPAPVTASPVATPGTAVRSADSGVNRGRPR